MTEIKWLIKWFESHCNDDWEHENQIQIFTTDNPGWTVVIDLQNTVLEKLNIDYVVTEKNNTDWFGYSIKDGKFKGSGDLNKLELLLKTFKEIAENNSSASH